MKRLIKPNVQRILNVIYGYEIINNGGDPYIISQNEVTTVYGNMICNYPLQTMCVRHPGEICYWHPTLPNACC